MKLLTLVAIGSMVAMGSASADMMLTGGPVGATATAEGYSLTHYDTPGDLSSMPTGSTQEYLLTSFSISLLIPDPQNYGLQISKGFLPSFGGIDVWDHRMGIGDAEWALNYYNPYGAQGGIFRP